jgi:hypothetical protein
MRNFFEGHEQGTYLLVSKPIKRRSLSQNSYIHAVLFPEAAIALRDAGFSEIRTGEDAKYVCKAIHLKKEIVNENTGEVITRIMDTHELTKEQMSIFIEDVVFWLQDTFGHICPMPNVQLSAF